MPTYQQTLIDKLSAETNIKRRTEIVQAWLINADNDIKLRFKLNWRKPHSLFNVMSNIIPSEHIQNIDWFTIYNQPDKMQFIRQ